MVTSNSEMEELIKQVSAWPVAIRRQLVRRVLETIDLETGPSIGRRKKPSSEVLGMLATDAPPPNDEECQRMLEDELIQKYQ